MSPANQLLLDSLSLAVALRIEELRDRPADQLSALATTTGQQVAQHGDDLQFGGEHCATTFNALATGLAAAALVAWGGITFCGLHWCATRYCSDPDADHPGPTSATDPGGRPRPVRQIEDVPASGALL
ncbi:hypothetical protein [Streptomyces boncukensis]|uniref:Uncharacterized protein n=1 Tax=Streptomyces boncukensis TaxID=2711219 RepID=A0A6G4X2U3_9ACTN|nr:hypothetical protein [Streptomyces boncukensis]NGO71825.1 hypothetical protein [Streptomyces boncukensis]